MRASRDDRAYVEWFRHSAPYIHAHRGRTFVIVVGGATIASEEFDHFVHDVALLHSLGVRLVIVHGAGPQVRTRLAEKGIVEERVRGVPIVSRESLACLKEAVGSVRFDIEALLSMGVASSPMANARIRVASGNFVTAQPLGVREGTDYRWAGQVRRVDAEGITKRLENGSIVLLSPLGYSPTGETFGVGRFEIAAATAAALRADKLLILLDGPAPHDTRRRALHQVTPAQANEMLATRPRLGEELRRSLRAAVDACDAGVRRAHLVPASVDGALMLELFTRDGVGTMVTGDVYEGIRPASIDDVGGILKLIAPLEKKGVLVHRSRERLEREIDAFVVLERDGAIIGCAALHELGEGTGELAAVAVNAEYREQGRGDAIVSYVEERARLRGLARLVLLTTQSEHFFRERGYVPARASDLPKGRLRYYNKKRGSLVLAKTLEKAEGEIRRKKRPKKRS